MFNAPPLYVDSEAKQSQKLTLQLKVRDLRKTIEGDRQLLYRQYADESEWERRVTEHLIAFLNRATKKQTLKEGWKACPPIGAIMHGRFYWQGL